MPPGMEERLQAARREVDRACELLVSASPESLDRCTQILETAGLQLAQLKPQPSERTARGGIEDSESLLEAHRLGASVLRAARLLEGAYTFHFTWNRLRGAMTFGYTERGDPAPVPGVSRISTQG